MKKVAILVCGGLAVLLISVPVGLLCTSRRHRTGAGPRELAKRVAPLTQPSFATDSSPDPVAPPEWNLVNRDADKDAKDPRRAYWSLEIMAFKVNPLRKEAAVKAVAAFRKDGVEAYYYHGETTSSVCVGAWPMDAVKPENRQLVGQGEALNARDAHIHHGARVVAWTDMTNDNLKQCVTHFHYHTTNYLLDPRQGPEGKMHEEASLLVVIPRLPKEEKTRL